MTKLRLPLLFSALLTTTMGPACSSDAGHPADGGVTADVADGGDSGDTGDGGADARLLVARSFQVTGKVMTTLMPPLSGPQVGVNDQTFTVWLDPIAKTMTLGVEGSASQVSLISADGETFTAAAPVRSFIAGNFPCGTPIITYEKFSIQVRGDLLLGAADGDLEVIMGDVAYRYALAMTMTGQPDITGPAFGAAVTGVDPLAGMFIKASEPMPAPTSATLTTAGGVRVDMVPFSPMDLASVVTGFHLPKGRALLYGALYGLGVIPGRDLAGNAAAPLPTVTTLALPVLATEDGFEGAATQLGGAQVIESPFLPPIAGAKSVFIAGFVGGATRRFTVRLPVFPGDKFVRVSLRAVYQFQQAESPYARSFRIAVPGGSIVAATLPDPELPTIRADDPTMGQRWLGKIADVAIPLPADAKDEIVFDASIGFDGNCGLFPPVPGYLIDDLRVE
jgi:hypothetical protein